MGLRGRLLAGLAVLVVVAIASTGWVTLAVARSRLEAVEVERVGALGGAVAELLGRSAALGPGMAGAAGDDAIRRALGDLVGAGGPGDPPRGGIREVAVIGAVQQTIAGRPDGDARLVAALHGDTLTERAAGQVTVYAPIRRAGGEIVGALRLRVAVSATLGEAEGGSFFLLAALTLVDGGLILLFGALFLRQLIRPLEALGRAAARVAHGDLEVAPLPPAPGELGTLTEAFNRMTEALREQRRHLEVSRAQVLAQEKLATVGRLAAGVAHEIGNPLTAVLGYVDLLLLDEKAPDAADLLQRIKGETGRIHHIVHELLDYARPAHEALEPVVWAEVLSAAEGLLRPQPRFRDVAVERALPPSLPPVAGSARRLLQVTLNLLLNAADAMGGRGTVRVAARVVGEAGGRVVLSLADSGPGVPPSDRDRVFDPFFTTKEPGGGTGLGLAVCRSIVETLGGTIELAGADAASAVAGTGDARGEGDAARHREGKPAPGHAALQQGARFEVTLPVWRAGPAG